MEFQQNVWNLVKSLQTALIHASQGGYVEIVKLLLEQDGIDINVVNVCLSSSTFESRT